MATTPKSRNHSIFNLKYKQMAKEKSITELKQERSQLDARAMEILNLMRGEKRQATEKENEELGEIQARKVEINMEIEEQERMARSKGKRVNGASERFSLVRAINAKMEGRAFNESDAAYINTASEEHRAAGFSAEAGAMVIPMFENRAAYTATAEAATGVVIDEDQQEMLLPLEANLVFSKAGVRMMTGLKGNIYWPKHSAVTVNWEGENVAAKDGSGKFEKGAVFAPKRLTAYVDISKQLLIQENQSVEARIRQLAAIAFAQKIEQTAFSKAAHADNVPDGMFQEAPTAVTGAMSWENIVKMEEKADLQNALFGDLAYVMHPSLVAKAKTKVKDASGAGGFIFQGNGDGLLNGYKALRTNNIPKELQDGGDEFGIIFGNWADYFLGQWGSLELLVDPYTQSINGMVRLVFTGYFDMGMIRPESFAIGSLK